MPTEKQIYFALLRYNKAILCVPIDDVLQEIRIVLFSEHDEIFRKASKAVYDLLHEYGLRKKGTRETPCEIEGVFSEQEDIIPLLEKMNEILDYYENHTVRETASRFGFKYNHEVQHAFNRYFPKNCGWGGKRKRGARCLG
jgi:hypothetical protein